MTANREFFDFCATYPDLRIERRPTGQIVIVSPAGAETAYRNGDLTAQLGLRSKLDERGRAFASNAQ